MKILTTSKWPLNAAIIRQVLLYLLAICIFALCSVKYFTISRLPSKQAARNGVEFVRVGWLTFAPAFTKIFTTFKCPVNQRYKKIVIIEIISAQVINSEHGGYKYQLAKRWQRFIKF